LKVLVLHYKNTNFYGLPGGFVQRQEDLDEAAKRILKDRVGLDKIFLEQFHTFGKYSRYDKTYLEKILNGRGITPADSHYLLKRFISVAYYALVDFTKVVPTTDMLADSCDWCDLEKLPILMQDHGDIITTALTTLQDTLDKKLIGYNLLPETFTMEDLQAVYETILHTKLLRTSFQRKMIKLDVFEKVDKKWTGAAHKAPYLYRIKQR
jgi:ADP-ribose pyrophosphatase YjhB (NUDIX family)